MCFSATIPQDNSNRLEQDVIACLNFKQFQYWPPKLPAITNTVIDRTVDGHKFDALKHEIKQLSKEQPVLVYTKSETAKMLASLLKNTKRVDQLTDAATFRECEKREEGQRFTTFVVDDPQQMRGTDWRSPTVGMALLLDRGFGSERDL